MEFYVADALIHGWALKYLQNTPDFFPSVRNTGSVA